MWRRNICPAGNKVTKRDPFRDLTQKIFYQTNLDLRSEFGFGGREGTCCDDVFLLFPERSEGEEAGGAGALASQTSRSKVKRIRTVGFERSEKQKTIRYIL